VVKIKEKIAVLNATRSHKEQRKHNKLTTFLVSLSLIFWTFKIEPGLTTEHNDQWLLSNTGTKIFFLVKTSTFDVHLAIASTP
jgi:hypothetical protein